MIQTIPEHAVEIAPTGLHGDLVVPERANGVILFAHGSGSSRHSPRNRYVAEVLQQGGFGTLLVDLLTEAEEQVDLRTRHLRFDIELLAGRLEEATDWLGQRRGVAISIVDTGIGIRPEDSKRLFQPFFSTKSTKGTGLGLWISKGIVQKYDGTLTCRSYRTQRGGVTCFRVFLPVAVASAGEPQKVEAELSQNQRAWQAV